MADVQVGSAFVDKVLTGSSGPFGVKTSEPHRRKNEQTGEWETTGRTFRDVTGDGIDWGAFAEGDRIAFFGAEFTRSREHEGKVYYSLTVRARAAAKVPSRGGQQAQGAPSAAPAGDWAAAPVPGAQAGAQGGWDETTPF